MFFGGKRFVFNLDHVVDNQRETRPDVDSSVKYFFFMKERSVFMYKFCKYINYLIDIIYKHLCTFITKLYFLKTSY